MKKKKMFLLVNFITSIRMLGVLLLTPLYLTYGGLSIALTNIICFLTDFVDGKLARKYKVSTFFGSIYDALADKMFLIINIVILCSITPWALIPILLEAGIVGVQTIKYKKNYNTKSSILGKIKMGVAGICVVLSNLLIDIEKLNFLGNKIINKLSKISDAKMVKSSLLPLVIAQIITLVGYILEMNKKDIQNNNLNNNNLEKDIQKEIRLSKEEIKNNERENLINQKRERLLNLKKILFDYDLYEKHKNDSNFNDMVKKYILQKK